MNLQKRAKCKEFLVKLLRLGQRKIVVHNKNLRIIMTYFNLKNENTATRYLKEMEQADMLTYDIKNNYFIIRKELDEKTRINEFEDK